MQFQTNNCQHESARATWQPGRVMPPIRFPENDHVNEMDLVRSALFGNAHRDIVPFCLPSLVITLLIHYHEFNKPGLLSIAG